jgi:cell division protein FtsL
MNTASRLISKNILSRGVVISLLLSRSQLAAIILLISILTSAISVVYMANSCRSLHALLQQKQVEKDVLHVQWNKLLLEKSTFSSESRVQHVAEFQLNMVMPDADKRIIVHAQGNA